MLVIVNGETPNAFEKSGQEVSGCDGDGGGGDGMIRCYWGSVLEVLETLKRNNYLGYNFSKASGKSKHEVDNDDDK